MNMIEHEWMTWGGGRFAVTMTCRISAGTSGPGFIGGRLTHD